MTGSLRTLLADLVDYAGLYPPATLSMANAVETYNRARMGEHEFMLGRFICPVAKLKEFSKAASPLLPGTHSTSGYREQADAGDPWRLSVILDPEALSESALNAQLDEIDAFNQHHSQEANGIAEVDMCEVKVADPNDIDSILDVLPDDIFPFFEFPVTTDCRGYITALSGAAEDGGAGAKIRTGGTVKNAFPTTSEISAFLHACAMADVPFKATAGLHHPVRSTHKLTYEPDAQTNIMHGFLNVFVAAALVRTKRIDDATTQAILGCEDASLFKFSDQVLGWKGYLTETMHVARARETFSLSFGSCSFDEPVQDLQALKLL